MRAHAGELSQTPRVATAFRLQEVAITMACSIHIDSVTPSTVIENEPFKVTWTVAAAEDFDVRNLTVALMTDDARLVLVDHNSQDSPPEKQIQVSPGARATKTTQVVIQRRKGLVDELSRDGSSSGIFLHARARNERDEIVADGAALEVQVAGLPRRTMPRIFL